MSATRNKSLIEPLRITIESGKDIQDEHVAGFVCCSRPIPHARIQPSGNTHSPKCLWHWGIRCQDCDYVTSLAKCIPDYLCKCHN